MSTYGIHECLYMDESITIEKASGDWYLSFTIWNREMEESEVVEFKIKFCPFCGENLEK